MKFDNIPTWQEWQSASSSFMTIRAHKPKLVRIDNLIKKYHQVFEMSKLNILMELKNAIIDWTADKIDRNVSTGRQEAITALEDVVSRKLYELDGWGRHRYLTALCVGYEVKTGSYAAPKPKDESERRKRETVDVGNRCSDLIAAIRAAHAKASLYVTSKHIPADEDRKMLKIFMAPEFYFRGEYGAYADIGWLSKIFSMMRTETGKAEYADWIFVLGSAVFQTEKTANKGVKQGLMLENFALVQKGGPKGTSELHDFYVEKEFPSHVDFTLGKGVGNVDWYDKTKTKAVIAGREEKPIMPQGGRKDPIYNPLDDKVKKVSEIVGGSIFTMQGITFGLEVCRDHYLKRLAHSSEHGKCLIQLIPSCGMDIEQDSISCVRDGLVFNVDGDAPHVHVQVNNSAGPQPTEMVPATAVSHGTVRLFSAVTIPWPGKVRADVAKRLGQTQNSMSGLAPHIPPRPAFPRK